jgi:hypothetical protein
MAIFTMDSGAKEEDREKVFIRRTLVQSITNKKVHITVCTKVISKTEFITETERWHMVMIQRTKDSGSSISVMEKDCINGKVETTTTVVGSKEWPMVTDKVSFRMFSTAVNTTWEIKMVWASKLI